MSKKSNNIFSKDYKYEDHIMLIIGVVVIIIGVLTMCGVISFEEEVNGQVKDNSFLYGVFFTMGGVLCTLMSFFKLKKQRKLKQNSIYYPILKDYDNKKIKDDLNLLGLDTSKVSIEISDIDLKIKYQCNKGCFALAISENYADVLFYYPDEVYDSEDESLIDKTLDDIYVEMDACKVTKDKMYSKFISTINEYEHLAK